MTLNVYWDTLLSHHDWLTFRADDSDEHPIWTSGYGPAPFSNDLLVPCSHDAYHEVLKEAGMAVARMTANRAHVFPAWAYAFVEALWGGGVNGNLGPGAPETVIKRALVWLAMRPDPAPVAAALVVVFWSKVEEAQAADAFVRVRLLTQAMRDFGDKNVSDEAP